MTEQQCEESWIVLRTDSANGERWCTLFIQGPDGRQSRHLHATADELRTLIDALTDKLAWVAPLSQVGVIPHEAEIYSMVVAAYEQLKEDYGVHADLAKSHYENGYIEAIYDVVTLLYGEEHAVRIQDAAKQEVLAT